MTPNPIQQAHELGQSFWLDYIRRDVLENGELARLIADGEVRGVTSNPSIFEKAIGGSTLYDSAMRPLAHAGWTAERIFESLAVHDIREATDLLLPVYEGTGGRDGFVSIEVNPQLADDTEATLEEARRLWGAVNRPNLMVKIPATPAGIPAIEQAIYEAININVTLIFALDRYNQVMQAYLRGLERRDQEGEQLDRIASVASFFVSRVDTAVDGQLELIVREEGPNAPRAAALLGHAAVANAKLAYAQFHSTFAEERFERLRQRGARVQRPLWASTSTKNPAYSDVLYVEQLIGPDTVNTLPPDTLEAFRDHGKAEQTLERDLADARAQLEAIEGLDISIDQVTQQLEQQGVEAFANSFEQLVERVDQRATQMRAELGTLQPQLGPLLEELESNRVASRFWRADASLWPKDGAPRVTDHAAVWQDLRPQIEGALEQLSDPAIQQVAWLAPDGLSWPVPPGHLRLESLDPADQRRLRSGTPTESSLFIVVSRHSRDPAAQAMLASSWRRAANRLGDRASAHFLVIAEEGSELAAQARSHKLPLVIGEPLSAAALVAAGLGQKHIEGLIGGAERVRERCAPNYRAAENWGLYLGALLAIAGRQARWRLGLLADPEAGAIAEWLACQFERSGVGRQLAVLRQVPTDGGDQDRVIVYLRSKGKLDREFSQWVEAGVPTVVVNPDFGLGGEAVRWEMGLGVAAHALELDPGPSPLEQQAAERFAHELERNVKKQRPLRPKPTEQLADNLVWWAIAERPAGQAESVQGYAEALGQRLKSTATLNLAILRHRAGPLQRTLADLRQRLAKLGVDLRVGWGANPNTSGLENEQLRQVSVLLCQQARRDEPVPEMEPSFGELQLMQAQAMFSALNSGRHECGLIAFGPSESVNDWLRALVGALA